MRDDELGELNEETLKKVAEFEELNRRSKAALSEEEREMLDS